MKSLFSSSHARPTVLFRLHRPYITEICVFFFLLLLSCTPMIRTQGSLSAPMCPLVSHPPAVVLCRSRSLRPCYAPLVPLSPVLVMCVCPVFIHLPSSVS
ncbi:hypothetical protein B0H11DRAFT_1948631 [Mycena galericulata]|nr:hypothetical protein B0H11DRAFT_2096879 [Mycena galericulata]KAJ7513084.1 hypothetical protein B0H11DRAFT_1948631 [Mycena galericulata]